MPRVDRYKRPQIPGREHLDIPARGDHLFCRHSARLPVMPSITCIIDCHPNSSSVRVARSISVDVDRVGANWEPFHVNRSPGKGDDPQSQLHSRRCSLDRRCKRCSCCPESLEKSCGRALTGTVHDTINIARASINYEFWNRQLVLWPILSLGNKPAQAHPRCKKSQKKRRHYEYNSSKFGPAVSPIKDER